MQILQFGLAILTVDCNDSSNLFGIFCMSSLPIGLCVWPSVCLSCQQNIQLSGAFLIFALITTNYSSTLLGHVLTASHIWGICLMLSVWVCLSLSLSVCLSFVSSVCPSIYHAHADLPVSFYQPLSVCLSLSLHIYLSVYLSLPIYLSVSQSLSLSVCPSVYSVKLLSFPWMMKHCIQCMSSCKFSITWSFLPRCFIVLSFHW